jgi:hypothetical protein
MKMKEFNLKIALHQMDNELITISAIERALLEYMEDRDVPVVLEIKEIENKEI